MTSFYYSCQNPWVYCFLVQIKAIVLLSSAELANLNDKAKTKWFLVVVVKYRHRTIVLFQVFSDANVRMNSFPHLQFLSQHVPYLSLQILWKPVFFFFSVTALLSWLLPFEAIWFSRRRWRISPSAWYILHEMSNSFFMHTLNNT